MKKIIIINGKPLSGKDTFINYVEGKLHSKDVKIYNYSSVDQVKEAARLLGWDKEKNSKGRRFLVELKRLSTAFYNGPEKYLLNLIPAFIPPYIAFFHIREPIEISHFISKVPEAKTMLLWRQESEDRTAESFNNSSDMCVREYKKYDYVFDTGKNLRELEEVADVFIRTLL